MKKYTPNFNDPRVQSKCRSALAWATSQLHEHKYNGWARKHLDIKIGYSHTNLGAYLRQQLLITHDSHYSMDRGFTKTYTLNTHGAVGLAQRLGIEYKSKKPRQSIGLSLAIQEYAPAFAQGVFEYTHKSGRSYNDMQNIKTDIRAPLFAHYGYRFDYDIVNAYPTLISEYLKQYTEIRKPYTYLDSYTQNTQAIRVQLAQAINCDIPTAKKILIAKFNGATLRPEGAVDRLLSRVQMHRLKHNTQWQLLCQDISRMWKGIARTEGRTSIPPRERMQRYCQEEQRVMRVIDRQFTKKNYRTFLEHDGLRATDWIDPRQLELRVLKATGMHIKIECEIHR